MHSYIRIFLSVLLLALASIAKAADDVLLIVQNTGGTVNDSTYIELSTNPTVTFGQKSLVVSAGNLELDYNDIVSISFTDKIPDPITTGISTAGNDVRLRFDGHSSVVIFDLPDNAAVNVFSVEGRSIPAAITLTGGNAATVSLAGQSNGVYIIKVGTKSFKITKR